MQVSIAYPEGLKCCMSFTFSPEEVNKKVQKAFQKLSREASIRGFRQGKVPFPVLKRRFSSSVREEVLSELA